MKSNDYVKYITQTVVKYIDQPKDERKRYKLEKKDSKEPFLIKWFGMLPYAFSFKRKYKKRQIKKARN